MHARALELDPHSTNRVGFYDRVSLDERACLGCLDLVWDLLEDLIPCQVVLWYALDSMGLVVLPRLVGDFRWTFVMHFGIQQFFACVLVVVCPARYRLVSTYKALPQVVIDAAEAVDEYRGHYSETSSVYKRKPGQVSTPIVPPNFRMAGYRFWVAACGGDVVSMANYGVLIERGRAAGGASPENLRIAAGWYRAAAREHSAFAMKRLGLMLREGRGVTRDETRAALLLEAADGDDEDRRRAVHLLGDLLDPGRDD